MKLKLVEARINHLEESVVHVVAGLKEVAEHIGRVASEVAFRSEHVGMELHRLRLDRSRIRVELMEALVLRGKAPSAEERGSFMAGLYVPEAKSGR